MRSKGDDRRQRRRQGVRRRRPQECCRLLVTGDRRPTSDASWQQTDCSGARSQRTPLGLSDGLLVIDKPRRPDQRTTSSRAMRRVLRRVGIGHTGTLDPAASGVLPLVLGRATRLARFLSGRTSATRRSAIRPGDRHLRRRRRAGRRAGAGTARTREQLEAALDAFRGTFEQQPPAFSAKKIAGRRSYEPARAARAVRLARPAVPARRPVLPAPCDRDGAPTWHRRPRR